MVPVDRLAQGVRRHPRDRRGRVDALAGRGARDLEPRLERVRRSPCSCVLRVRRALPGACDRRLGVPRRGPRLRSVDSRLAPDALGAPRRRSLEDRVPDRIRPEPAHVERGRVRRPHHDDGDPPPHHRDHRGGARAGRSDGTRRGRPPSVPRRPRPGDRRDRRDRLLQRPRPEVDTMGSDRGRGDALGGDRRTDRARPRRRPLVAAALHLSRHWPRGRHRVPLAQRARADRAALQRRVARAGDALARDGGVLARARAEAAAAHDRRRTPSARRAGRIRAQPLLPSRSGHGSVPLLGGGRRRGSGGRRSPASRCTRSSFPPQRSWSSRSAVLWLRATSIEAR